MADRLAELTEMREKLLQFVYSKRGWGFSLAAENLEYFLLGRGGEKQIPLPVLRLYRDFTDGADRLRDRVAVEVVRALVDLMDRGDGSTTIFVPDGDRTYATGFTAPLWSDLFWASATSSLRAEPQLDVRWRRGEAAVEGDVRFVWWDPYDWTPGDPLSKKLPPIAVGWGAGIRYLELQDLSDMHEFGLAKFYILIASWVETMRPRDGFHAVAEELAAMSSSQRSTYLDGLDAALGDVSVPIKGVPGLVIDWPGRSPPRDWFQWYE